MYEHFRVFNAGLSSSYDRWAKCKDGEYISSIDTDEHLCYPVCYRVNDAKTFKNPVYMLFYSMLANHHVYY